MDAFKVRLWSVPPRSCAVALPGFSRGDALVRFDPRPSTSTLVATALEVSTGNAVPHDSFFYDLLRSSTTRRRNHGART